MEELYLELIGSSGFAVEVYLKLRNCLLVTVETPFRRYRGFTYPPIPGRAGLLKKYQMPGIEV
jgi:hypothetical protein